MSAFNIVRFRVKPGNEQQFIDQHRKLRPTFKGFLGGHLVKTGDRTFCVIGQWRNFRSIVAARPQMSGFLDGFREMLEDLGGGLGVTDPVSGESVLKLPTSKPKAVKKASKPKKKTKTKNKKKGKKKSSR